MATVAESPSTGEARPGDDAPPAAEAPPVRSQTLVAVATLSVAAGVIHAVAMIDHFSHYWLYGVFFLVVTYAQVLWGIWVYRHQPNRRVLVAGAAGSLAISAVWLVSRTVGVPIGPDTWNPERVGIMDVMATIDQIAIAGFVVALVVPATRLYGRVAAAAAQHSLRIGIMLSSASLFSILVGNHHHH